ncbi:acylphosphatase [Anopheles sinensis]|uniref:Acylphosphatase n=1 Tax=Anopheles sinensis TaxID=74873 RepID=A0A084VGE8_ANOSI|nr:acylphosphatase [Anopheles sinensis]
MTPRCDIPSDRGITNPSSSLASCAIPDVCFPLRAATFTCGVRRHRKRTGSSHHATHTPKRRTEPNEPTRKRSTGQLTGRAMLLSVWFRTTESEWNRVETHMSRADWPEA